MSVFMVGYDLKSGEDYAPLIAAVKTYTKWWHHLDSTWIIETDESAVQIRDYLAQFIFAGDKILVAHVGAPAAWKGFSDRGGTWLKENLK